ncbi:hypothetical protein [Lentilactobacillus parabuchneri]|jgi:hypothetical protein|uniref:Uncharacterized protein n=1 Tax=Lentilactobacillus parabuchneri TaxID=152331 RepID=A0A844ECB6_9LACO|nr:hypothetical protein [Lentilactobacillus parabuchneri]
MTDDQFEKIVNEEFDDVVDLAQQDFDFVYELLRENSNADAIFYWASDNQEEVLDYLGLGENGK